MWKISLQFIIKIYQSKKLEKFLEFTETNFIQLKFSHSDGEIPGGINSLTGGEESTSH